MGFVAGALGLTQAFTGVVGAFEQRGIDKERVQLAYQDNLEKIRRRSFTQEQVLGETKARSQASGVRHTGGSTAQGTIDVMSTEFKRELEWMQRYAKRARTLGLKSADVDFTKNVMGSLSEGIGTAAGAFG